MKTGIVGTGMIVHEFLRMQKERPEIEVTAIVSREKSREKLEALSKEYEIPEFYTDYEEFLQKADLDVVYVGIISSKHYEYVKKALEAGKHVINEKPFTSTLEEAEELAELAKKKGLYLFEAITLLHFPNYHWIQEHIGQLGKICMVQGNFSQYSSRYDRYLKKEVLPAFDPALSGGALYDINIYNLHFTAGLFGRPEEVSYKPRIGFNGIDTSGAVILSYPDFTAVLTGAKDSASPGYVVIQGEKGYIKVHGIPSECREIEAFLDGEKKTFSLNENRHRMTDEMLEFDRILKEQDREAMERLLAHSLTVMEIAFRARKDGGIRFGADQ